MERTQKGESARPATGRPSAKRRRPVAIALRVGLIAIIVVVLIGLAHVLRNPAGFSEEEGPVAGRADPQAGPSPEVEVSGGSQPTDATPTTPKGIPTDRQEADDDLRRVMAGLIMGALDDDGEADPERTPTEQQRRLADLFALPYDYPHSQAPADLVPAEAEVMMVFDNPQRPGCRMVLVRMPGDVASALEAFHRHYASLGWDADRLPSPREDRASQPDRGWLVRFRKGARSRVVYARPRWTGEETLVALYDPNYAGH